MTTEPTTTHATFTIERRLKATPERVFRAWADREAKARWFGTTHQGWTEQVREMDFRAGGTEHVKGMFAHGMVSDFQARYFDIVPNRRIVYTYDMYVDGRKLSVSLATIELVPDGECTRLRITEQGAFFDSLEDVERREQGTVGLMDALERSLLG